MCSAVISETNDLLTRLGGITSAAVVMELNGVSANGAVMCTAGNMEEGITDDTGSKLTWQGVE